MKKKTMIAITITICILLGIFIHMALTSNDNGIQDVVYVIVKSASDDIDFWQTVKLGAETAAAEMNVEMRFTGPANETNIDDQISIVQAVIQRKPMAIVLAPTDFKRLAPLGEEIIEAGITLVVIDSAIDTPAAKSLIATNNVKASQQAGQVMIDLLEGSGEVAIMSHVPGTSTAIERVQGFREAVEGKEAIALIEETWYSYGSADRAYEVTLEMLDKHPDIKGIFGTNEVTVIGIARALDSLGLGGKIMLVGFDGNHEEVSFIERGILHAVMVQRPFNMGYLGVKEAVALSRTKKQPQYIDTGAILVTRENLYTPENQKLLFPFVE